MGDAIYDSEKAICETGEMRHDPDCRMSGGDPTTAIKSLYRNRRGHGGGSLYTYAMSDTTKCLQCNKARLLINDGFSDKHRCRGKPKF